MILEKEYLEAKEYVKKYSQIVMEYETQEKIKRETEQHLRETKCGESKEGHHYEPTNTKCQPVIQRQCCHCGHTIE